MKSIMILAGLAATLPSAAGTDAVFSTGYEPLYSVGGNISGLTALGENVEISLNGVMDLTAIKDGPYTLANEAEAGQIFDVTIDNSNCTIMNGSGIMPHNDVTNADIDCPLAFTTVYDIKQGFATGTVALQNMLVTVCKDDVGYNLQTVPSDPDYIGDDYSGIYVFDNTVDCMALQVGDRIDVNPGTVNDFIGEIQLSNVTYAIQSSGNPLPTPVLTTTAALDVFPAHPLNGVLVEVQNVTVSNLDSPNFEYEVDNSLTVSDRHYLTAPFPEISETMTFVRGPLAYNFDLNKIDPRSANDLGREVKMVINEVDYDQPGADTTEFVEIYNTGPDADLSDLVLFFVNGSNSAIYGEQSLSDGGSTLNHGEYLVIGSATVINALPPSAIGIVMDSLSIQNGAPDGFILVNTVDETILDALSYEGAITSVDIGFVNPVSLVEGTATTAVDNGDGSLSRVPNGQDTDDADTDWQFWTTITPGTSNLTNIGPISLLINEVDYDQPADDNLEFIEIYNPSSSFIDLSQIDVVLVNGSNNLEYDRLTLSGVLNPGEYAVIADAAVSVPLGVPTFLLVSGSIQNGSPDGIALVDNINNTLIDALSYEGSITAAVIDGFAGPVSLVEGSPTTAIDAGTGSIIRSPDGGDSGDDSIDFQLSANPTPGEENTL